MTSTIHASEKLLHCRLFLVSRVAFLYKAFDGLVRSTLSQRSCSIEFKSICSRPSGARSLRAAHLLFFLKLALRKQSRPPPSHCKTCVIPRPVYASVWPGYGPYTGHSLLRVPGIGLVLPTRPQVRVCAILIPWSGYPEQCTLARVQEMVHTLSRVWTVHPGQGMSIAHAYPDMGILLFPGQDDFLQFIIFWLILLCTLTHSCSLPRVPCIPYIPCPGFHGYPAHAGFHTYPALCSMHTLPWVPCTPCSWCRPSIPFPQYALSRYANSAQAICR